MNVSGFSFSYQHISTSAHFHIILSLYYRIIESLLSGEDKLKGKKMGGEPPKRMISLSYQTKTLILCPNIAFLPDSPFLHSY